MQCRVFGTTDREDVSEITLSLDNGTVANILTWGALVRELNVPCSSGLQSVVLGLNSIEDYINHSPSFGVIPGRFANRIGSATFELDGKTHHLTPNKGSIHCLHGGPNGYGKRNWSLGNLTKTSVTLHLDSPDGDAGFPGHAQITCIYNLLPPSTLRVDLYATSDAPTPMNLTHHSYFNLDGSADARDHEVQLFANFYTPTDADLIPTGEVRAVAGTPYDFTTMRPVRNAHEQVFDTNFVVSSFPDTPKGLVHMANMRSNTSKLTMEVHSSEQGVQFYDGAKVSCPVPGLGGTTYGAHAGLCFEPQNFPDAPNKRHFPNSILRKGEIYQHAIEYRFI